MFNKKHKMAARCAGGWTGLCFADVTRALRLSWIIVSSGITSLFTIINEIIAASCPNRATLCPVRCVSQGTLGSSENPTHFRGTGGSGSRPVMPVTGGAGFVVLRSRDRVPVVPASAHKRTRRARQGSTVVALVLAGTLCAPGLARAMSADGALITNGVSATFYGIGGLGLPNAYRITYIATANVLVSCPVVIVKKQPNTSFQAVGGLVTFRIWVVNSSLQASSFNVCVTDRLPDNMEYVGPAPFALTWTWAPTGQWYGTGSTTNAPPWTAPVAGTVGQDPPFYLRWCIPQLGPGKSAFVEFSARVL